MQVCLRTFLRTGCFGNINIGSLRSQVETAFGPPPDWSAKSDFQKADLWKYGDVEFHFLDNRVWCIFSDHGELVDGGGSIEIEQWIIRKGISCDFLGEQLQHEQIDFKVSVSSYDHDRRVLLTSAGVSLCFSQADSQSNAEFGLESWSSRAK